MTKWKLLTGAVLAALALSSAPLAHAGSAQPAPLSQSDRATAQAILSQGMAKLHSKNFKGAEEDFRAIINNPKFPQQSEQVRYFTYCVLAAAERMNGENQAAYDNLTLAGQASPGSRESHYWFSMMDATFQLDKADALADTVTELAKNYPDKLNAGDDGSWWPQVVRKVRLGADPLHYQLMLEAFRTADYHPTDPFVSNEYIARELVQVYADTGKDAAAQALSATLVKPYSILSFQVDKRYSRFAPAGVDRYAKALDDEVVKDRALAEAHPDLIEGAQNLAQGLLADNKPEDALSVVDAAIAKAATGTKDHPAYTDLDRYLNWTLDTRRRVLVALGRWDEAIAAQIKARDAAKDDMVSQKINLADLYYEVGRPKDALAELKDFDRKDATSYGVMAAEEARGCAYAQLGDKASLTASLDYMKAHATDGYGALISVLTCAGDVDALTAMVVKRLDDPEERNAALVDLQIFQPNPHLTDWDRKMVAVHDQVAARPEVRAAVEKYGVINTYPTMH